MDRRQRQKKDIQQEEKEIVGQMIPSNLLTYFMFVLTLVIPWNNH